MTQMNWNYIHLVSRIVAQLMKLNAESDDALYQHGCFNTGFRIHCPRFPFSYCALRSRIEEMAEILDV